MKIERSALSNIYGQVPKLRNWSLFVSMRHQIHFEFQKFSIIVRRSLRK